MKLICEEDCGNAPKKQYILDFNIAFAKADISKILEMFDDDAIWDMVGSEVVKGKVAIKNELESMAFAEAKVLEVENIISHGKLCSANGEMHHKDSKVAFCDVYTFSSHAKDAKIKTLKSYGIDIK